MTDEPLDRLRALCLALPETTERVSHGEPSWFVRDKKLFVTYTSHQHEGRASIWCAAPEGAQGDLISLAQFFYPPYVGMRGWIGVWLDGPVDWDEVAFLVTEAYRVVAPKQLVALLDKGGID